MSPPPREPPERTRPDVPRPRGRENTRRGIGPTQGPELREFSDDPESVEHIDELESRLRGALAENKTLRRSRDALSQSVASRSISPAPGSLREVVPLPRVEQEETLPSVRPGKDWVLGALRLAGPKAWIVLLVGVLLWGLGGPDGIAKLIREWRSGETQALVTAMTARISALETETTRLRTALVAQRQHQLELQGAQSQVFERMGVDWPLEAGAPAPALLRFEQPIRRPGTVTKGPTLIVQTPMRIPPAVPSAGQ